MKCNLCQNSEFGDMGSRKGVRCIQCNSLERTRLIWLYIQRLNIQRDWKVLHIAPEKGLHSALSSMLEPANYIVADIAPERYPFAQNSRRMDLCNLEDEPSSEYDLILHSHVMEHVPCNIAYSLFHLHRMMKAEGTHLCIIPFMPGGYDECFQDIGKEERERRFGQWDHVRRIGADDRSSHLGKLINLPDHFDATDEFTESQLREANIPENCWRGFHSSTVLNLGKHDMAFIKGDICQTRPL